jgi:hypothetical protein
MCSRHFSQINIAPRGLRDLKYICKKDTHTWFSFSFCRNPVIHTDGALMIVKSVTRILNLDSTQET